MKQVVVVLLFLVSSLYVTGVYGNFGLSFDISNLGPSTTEAIGTGVTPLVNVNSVITANLAKDTTGSLALLQKVVANATEPLGTLLKTLQEATTATDKAILKKIFDLCPATVVSLGYKGPFGESAPPTDGISAITYASQLYAKLSTFVYNDLTKKITDLTSSIYQDDNFADTFYSFFKQLKSGVEAASTSVVTSDTIFTYVSDDVVKGMTTATAKVVNSIGRLSVSIQLAVLELVPPVVEVPVAPVDPVITSRLPNIVEPLASFNASADSTRNSLKQTGKSLAKDATSAYNPVISNPWNWNDGNIGNLTKFLANFTALLQNNFTQSLDAGIDSMKGNVNATLTNQVSQLAQVFTSVYTNISDSNTTSSSIFKAKCVSSYNASLLTIPPTVSRLGNCIQLEGDSVGVINSHTSEAIRKAKDDATKPWNQLQLCREQSGGACTKKIFGSFVNRYQSAVTALQQIADYTTFGMEFITGRLSDCMSNLSAEIQLQTQTVQVNFNRCLTYGNF